MTRTCVPQPRPHRARRRPCPPPQRRASAQRATSTDALATTMVYPVGDPAELSASRSPAITRVSASSRGVNLGRRGDRHEGLDLANRTQGAEVRAVAPGLVICTRKDYGSGWGNMVAGASPCPARRHVLRFATSPPGSIRVEEGQIVALGQPLGKVSIPAMRTARTSIRVSQPDRSPAHAAGGMAQAKIVDPMRIFLRCARTTTASACRRPRRLGRHGHAADPRGAAGSSSMSPVRRAAAHRADSSTPADARAYRRLHVVDADAAARRLEREVAAHVLDAQRAVAAVELQARGLHRCPAAAPRERRPGAGEPVRDARGDARTRRRPPAQQTGAPGHAEPSRPRVRVPAGPHSL